MKRVILLLTCLLSVQSYVKAGELYRWLDSSGKVHYGDMPPAGPTQVEAIEIPAAPTPDLELPYETRRAQQNFPVTLYVAENCVEQCKLARSLLTSRGIPFSEKMLRSNAELDAFRALTGGDTIPTLAVGKNFMKGFLETQWQSELDVAGYPKTAPYRGPKALPATAPGAAATQVAPLTLYVVASCIEHCNRARKLLTKRGIPFNEKLLKSKEEIEAFKQLSGSTLAPTLELGGSFLKGFQAEQWDNELDAASYPKASAASTAAP